MPRCGESAGKGVGRGCEHWGLLSGCAEGVSRRVAEVDAGGWGGCQGAVKV